MNLGQKPYLVREITNADRNGYISGTRMVGVYMNNNRVYYNRDNWFSLKDWYHFFVVRVWNYTGIELPLMDEKLIFDGSY